MQSGAAAASATASRMSSIVAAHQLALRFRGRALARVSPMKVEVHLYRLRLSKHRHRHHRCYFQAINRRIPAPSERKGIELPQPAAPHARVRGPVRRFRQALATITLLSLVPPQYRLVTAAAHNLEHLAIFLSVGIAFGAGYPDRP